MWGGNQSTSQRVRVTGNDVFVFSRVCGQDPQGGDVYYLTNCASGLITRFAIADVAGHGKEAGETADSLRRLMRKYINMSNQTRLAQSLNKSFGELARNGRFATAILGTYFAPTKHLILCNAGHPRPFLYRAAESRWIAIDASIPGAVAESASRDVGIRNLPLGIIEPAGYEQVAFPIAAGDMLVLYTDALLEAADPTGKMLGEAGLLDLLTRLGPGDPEVLAKAIHEAVLARRGGAALDDDATVAVMRHDGADTAHPKRSRIIRSLGKMIGL